MIRTTTSTAPAHWASYVNDGDATGISEADINACDAWLLRLAVDGWSVLMASDGEDPYFAYENDAGTLACDVVGYVLVKRG